MMSSVSLLEEDLTSELHLNETNVSSAAQRQECTVTLFVS